MDVTILDRCQVGFWKERGAGRMSPVAELTRAGAPNPSETSKVAIGNVRHMGHLDFLFGGKTTVNCEVVADRLWMTADAKFTGLAREVQQRSNGDTVGILLVAHFSDVLARLSEISAASTDVPIKAVLACNLTPDIAATLALNQPAVFDVIVGERHPLNSVDAQLAEFARALPCRCRLTHHLSLDDPIMQIFAGPWVQNMLGRLGMSEDETIESTMVSRRFKAAQKKIESKALGNAHADSAGEWLLKNCPELAGK